MPQGNERSQGAAATELANSRVHAPQLERKAHLLQLERVLCTAVKTQHKEDPAQSTSDPVMRTDYINIPVTDAFVFLFLFSKSSSSSSNSILYERLCLADFSLLRHLKEKDKS